MAALVAYLLRKKGQRSTRCYAYSPPGSLISGNAVPEFQKFCVSVIAGDDLVPRLSRNSMDVLKADVSRLIRNCDRPKWQIFGSVVGNMCQRPSKKTRRIIKRWKHRGILQQDPCPHITAKELLDIRKTTLSIPRTWRDGVIQDVLPEHVVHLTSRPVFIPGRIIYLEKLRGFGVSPLDSNPSQTNTQSMRNEPFGKASLIAMKQAITAGIQSARRIKDYKYVYIPRWATNDEFQEIIVSRSMMADHLCFGMLREFEDLPKDHAFLITS